MLDPALLVRAYRKGLFPMALGTIVALWPTVRRRVLRVPATVEPVPAEPATPAPVEGVPV
jgi:Leu/Phe-tRNA-protein transferase